MDTSVQYLMLFWLTMRVSWNLKDDEEEWKGLPT